mmetsp:Transcript_43652/g.79623  ORF Transcript_43652/g.79623 Transcript_43652/m.79623 type:complete len:143 (-) Transcript_43652:464-892(-)
MASAGRMGRAHVPRASVAQVAKHTVLEGAQDMACASTEHAFAMLAMKKLIAQQRLLAAAMAKRLPLVAIATLGGQAQIVVLSWFVQMHSAAAMAFVCMVRACVLSVSLARAAQSSLQVQIVQDQIVLKPNSNLWHLRKQLPR